MGYIRVGIYGENSDLMERLKSKTAWNLERNRWEGYQIELFWDKSSFCEAAAKGPYDLVIVDLDNPDGPDFKISASLKLIAPDTTVILVSEHEEMVFKSFYYQPLWFVRKNCMDEDMKMAIGFFLKNYRKRYIMCVFKGRDKMYRISSNDILYLSSYQHNITVVSSVEAPFVCRDSIEKRDAQLEPYGFLRILKTYLVNIVWIQDVGQDVIMKNGVRLAVSRGKRKDIKEQVRRYQETMMI